MVLEANDVVLEGNDREVIDACRSGDRDAFRALFETYQDRVYSIALRYSGDRTVALDIAQETFLKLLSTIQDFRGDSSFESWLYRIVVNRCLDYRRRSRRVAAFFENVLAVFRGPDESALDGMLRNERQERVQKMVGKLPAEQRIVVVLRYTEGLSYEQISGILGCSRGTVASRLNRAHKSLERQLSPLRRGRS